MSRFASILLPLDGSPEAAKGAGCALWLAERLGGIAVHRVDLVVMSARGESASAGLELSQRLGTVAQAVLERSPVPVLLLPARYREALPWTSMLAAASGERAADQALEAAVRLATALRLKVTVVHSEDGPPAGTAPLGAYADAPRRTASVLALGWHGALAAGRAPVLKRLLAEAECALLLVRAAERSPARLKVGAEIDER